MWALVPVRQTRISAHDGDCYRACLASILELPLGEVPPPPDGDGDWDTWHLTVLNPWLMDRFGVISHAFEITEPDGDMAAGLHWIGCTKPGPLGANHAVVFDGRECVWDPERGGPGRFTVSDLEQGTVFIACDPARRVAA